MKQKIVCTLWLLFTVFLGAQTAQAADFSISPVLIDVDATARDIVTKDITLKNNSSGKLVLYATVNEIAVDDGGAIKEFVSPVMTDRTNTVTSWLEISRGRIELEAGESEVIPLTIRINPKVEAGDYHAFIGFVKTNKRPDAEATALRGDADGVIVKVSIVEKQNELLRISSFLIDKFIFVKERGDITIEVENTGESPSIPTGEIIFYNSRGEEVSSMPVNSEQIEAKAGERTTITTKIPFEESLGRYKANLVLRYGNDQQAAVFDTAQFFMVPLPILIGILVLIVVISLVLTYLLHKAFYNKNHEHEDGDEIPLYIRNDRNHVEKDHDIHLSKDN